MTMTAQQLLVKIKEASSTDATFKSMLEAGSDADAAARGNAEKHWGTQTMRGLTSKAQALSRLNALVGPPIFEKMVAIAAYRAPSEEPTELELAGQAMAIRLGNLLDVFNVGLDFGDPEIRDIIDTVTDDEDETRLTTEERDTLYGLGEVTVAVRHEQVSEAMALVRLNGTAEVQENWYAL